MLTAVSETTLERRLSALGFVTYDEYLQSSYWRDTRMRWQQAGMPEECLICHRGDYSLHHRSYERIGEERVIDLVALCEPHHYEVHRLLKRGLPGITLWDAHLHYRKLHHARKGRSLKRIDQVLHDNLDLLFAGCQA